MGNSGTSTAPCTRSGGETSPAAQQPKVMSHNDQGTRVLSSSACAPPCCRATARATKSRGSPWQRYEGRYDPPTAAQQSRKALATDPTHRLGAGCVDPTWGLLACRHQTPRAGRGPRCCSAPSGGLGGLPCQTAQTLSSSLRFLYHSTDIVRNACRLALWGEEGGDDRRETSASAPGRRRGR